MDWAYGTYGEEEKCLQVFGRGSEGKRQLGKPRPTWKYDIKMDSNGFMCLRIGTRSGLL
jgi:hypothetical protein